jgi:hypothetical protein
MTSRWAQTILALWIAASTHVDALAADEATASLRREHREEALELRQQHAGESAPPEAPESEGEVAQARQARERQAQDALHARQLRKQLQSAHIRQQQAPGEAASAAQIELQQFRRERDAARLQMELLRPLLGPRGH